MFGRTASLPTPQRDEDVEVHILRSKDIAPSLNTQKHAHIGKLKGLQGSTRNVLMPPLAQKKIQAPNRKTSTSSINSPGIPVHLPAGKEYQPELEIGMLNSHKGPQATLASNRRPSKSPYASPLAAIQSYRAQGHMLVENSGKPHAKAARSVSPEPVPTFDPEEDAGFGRASSMPAGRPARLDSLSPNPRPEMSRLGSFSSNSPEEYSFNDATPFSRKNSFFSNAGGSSRNAAVFRSTPVMRRPLSPEAIERTPKSITPEPAMPSSRLSPISQRGMKSEWREYESRPIIPLGASRETWLDNATARVASMPQNGREKLKDDIADRTRSLPAAPRRSLDSGQAQGATTGTKFRNLSIEIPPFHSLHQAKRDVDFGSVMGMDDSISSSTPTPWGVSFAQRESAQEHLVSPPLSGSSAETLNIADFISLPSSKANADAMSREVADRAEGDHEDSHSLADSEQVNAVPKIEAVIENVLYYAVFDDELSDEVLSDPEANYHLSGLYAVPFRFRVRAGSAAPSLRVVWEFVNFVDRKIASAEASMNQLVRDEHGRNLRRKAVSVLRIPANHSAKTALAFLVAAYLMIRKERNPVEAFEPFASSHLGFSQLHFGSAGADSTCLSIEDCLCGLRRAMEKGWYSQDTFDSDGIFERARNSFGNMHSVTPKIVVMRGPRAVKSPAARGIGHEGFPEVQQVAANLKSMQVNTVIRLSSPLDYACDRLVELGFRHFDINMAEGGCPSPHQIKMYLKICETSPGVIAVHSQESFGRAGTMVAVWLMWREGFTAREAISWMRMVRPGSITGVQQTFLMSWCAKEENKDMKRCFCRTSASFLPLRGSKLIAPLANRDHTRRRLSEIFG